MGVEEMMEHPNTLLARRAWDASSRGDAEALRATMHEDIVWRATARGAPWAGTHKGRDAVVEVLARVGEVSEGFKARLVDILVSDERVLFVFHMSLRRRGRVAEVDYVMLGTLRDGLFSEMWTTPLDPATIENFWAGQRV
jgi:ketosteroid isomerase-like protein